MFRIKVGSGMNDCFSVAIVVDSEVTEQFCLVFFNHSSSRARRTEGERLVLSIRRWCTRAKLVNAAESQVSLNTVLFHFRQKSETKLIVCVQKAKEKDHRHKT